MPYLFQVLTKIPYPPDVSLKFPDDSGVITQRHQAGVKASLLSEPGITDGINSGLVVGGASVVVVVGTGAGGSVVVVGGGSVGSVVVVVGGASFGSLFPRFLKSPGNHKKGR